MSASSGSTERTGTEEALAPIAVVVTGLLREPEKLRRSVEEWCVLGESGLISLVRMVTWRGERDSSPDLCRWLASRGVEVMVLEEPPIRGLGNVWAQMLALDRGLEGIADEMRVFKTRADVWIDPEYLRRIAWTPGFLESGIEGNRACRGLRARRPSGPADGIDRTRRAA